MASQNENPVELHDVSVDELSEVWLYQFVPSTSGEPMVVPVNTKKTDKFSGRLVACEVTFANESKHWALIEGLDLEAPEFSRHNREIRIFVRSHGWFHLAQYFDGEAIKQVRGETVLAEKLGLSLGEIFPIHFDVRNRSKTDSDCLHGFFEVNPKWGLPRAEVMALLVKELSNK